MNIKKITKKVIYSFHKNPVSKLIYSRDINHRSKLKLTDVENLSKNINMFFPYTSELQPINGWYGHATVLKKFLGLPQIYKFKFIIEHGLYLSNQIAEAELEVNLPAFVTYSKFRTKILEQHRSKAYAIGPFIHYATQYLTHAELAKEKRRLGKHIVFFPSHPLFKETDEYDIDWSYRKIRAISKNFDSVRVCLYWKDVLAGKYKYYQSKGFECVTAGHILDPLFLSRLKSILYISDLTVSNDASSPLSYSIYMNKPHIIFYQRPKVAGNKHLQKIMVEYWNSKPYKQIVEAFSKIHFKITHSQRDLINYYCGTDNIKSKSALLKIVYETERLYASQNQKNKIIFFL